MGSRHTTSFRRRRTAAGVGALVAIGGIGAWAIPRVYQRISHARLDPRGLDVHEGSGGPGLSPDQADGTWVVAAGSFAGYRVQKVLNGVDVTVVGRTDEVSGTVEIADGDLVTGTVTVDLASVDSGDAKRDEYFRDKALTVSEYPEATFMLSDPVRAVAGLTAAGTPAFDIVGDVSIRGVTRQITTEVSVAVDGETVRVAGSIPAHFPDFGVTIPTLPFVKVDEDGSIEFSLVLRRKLA